MIIIIIITIMIIIMIINIMIIMIIDFEKNGLYLSKVRLGFRV